MGNVGAVGPTGDKVSLLWYYNEKRNIVDDGCNDSW